MARLNIERQESLEPKRMEHAITQLDAAGISPIIVSGKAIEFEFKNRNVIFWPYSGYFNGKSVKAGRGIKKLLDQLKQ